MQLHRYVDLILLSLAHTVACATRTTQLYFNSHNCDEAARRVTEDKSYVLKWTGKIDPHPCLFNFTAGEEPKSYLKYKLCFRSEDFEMTTPAVTIRVTDGDSSWTYNKYDPVMEEICRERVEDLGIWLEIDKDYQYVESTGWESLPPLVTIKVTAEKLPKLKEGIWDQIKRSFQGLLPFIIITLVIMVICTNKTGRERSKELFRALAACICGKEETDSSTDQQTSLSLTNDTRSDSQIELTVDGTLPPPYQEDDMQYTTAMHQNLPPPSYEDITSEENKNTGPGAHS